MIKRAKTSTWLKTIIVLLALLAFYTYLNRAVGQGGGSDVSIDSIQAFIENDKNCSDFDDRLSAQSHFEALEIIVLGDGVQDPHELDADDNGYACEGKEYMRWIKLSEPDSIEGYQIRTVETVHSVRCKYHPDYWINITDYSNKMSNAPFNQIEYMPSWSEGECLDTLYEIYSNTQP